MNFKFAKSILIKKDFSEIIHAILIETDNEKRIILNSRFSGIIMLDLSMKLSEYFFVVTQVFNNLSEDQKALEVLLQLKNQKTGDTK